MSKSKKLLIVEDNALNRRVLCKILSDEYETLEAENGAEALERLRQEQEKISLVLLDLVMPVMDGYTFLTEYKKYPEICNIPVIVVTQKEGDNNEVEALRMGAADFLTKPYKPQIIQSRIANIINLREKSAMLNLLERDSLTGLLRKEFFFFRVDEFLRQNPSDEYNIVCCDIISLRFLNERLGRRRCNQMLQKIGEVLLDYADHYTFCGRIGGGVFGFLAKAQPCYSDATFAEIIEQLRQIGVESILQFKFGIYPIGKTPLSADIMCDRAILALDAVKNRYDALFAIYDDRIRIALLEKQFISEHMQEGLRNREFILYLQPKYDIKTREIVGAEVLVRWIQPEKGMLMPADFIPIFEANGFIEKLDYYMWEETCRLIAQWKAAGKEVVPISVNVSRIELFEAQLPERLLTLLEKYHLSPAELHLEITESAYTNDTEQLIAMVIQLREIGFTIEMDDFGAGYSSLNMISKLPVDVLKLDMRFMDALVDDHSSNIISFVILLSQWKKLKVVAEGVERQEELELLSQLGCDYAQGYFFAKPMPPDQFAALLPQLI